MSQLAFPGAPEYTTFTFVVTASVVTCILGTFLGKPAKMEVLVHFYRKTKPFGFWGPVRKACDPGFVANVHHENRRDLLLLAPASLWQAALFWMMTCFVVKKWGSFAVTTAVVAILSFILYRYWYLPLSGRASAEGEKTAG